MRTREEYRSIFWKIQSNHQTDGPKEWADTRAIDAVLDARDKDVEERFVVTAAQMQDLRARLDWALGVAGWALRAVVVRDVDGLAADVLAVDVLADAIDMLGGDPGQTTGRSPADMRTSLRRRVSDIEETGRKGIAWKFLRAIGAKLDDLTDTTESALQCRAADHVAGLRKQIEQLQVSLKEACDLAVKAEERAAEEAERCRKAEESATKWRMQARINFTIASELARASTHWRELAEGGGPE